MRRSILWIAFMTCVAMASSAHAAKWPSDEDLSAWRDAQLAVQQAPNDVARLRTVQKAVNRARYVRDVVGNDYWGSPTRLLERGGDCEDFAVTKYLLLRDAVEEPERLRILIVYDDSYGQHAILEYRGSVLDNRLHDLTDIIHYAVIAEVLPGGKVIWPSEQAYQNFLSMATSAAASN